MYIHVKVKTNQKKEIITELKENYFEIFVKEKAEKNMANNRIINILQSYFKGKKIRLINGHKSQSKLFSIG